MAKVNFVPRTFRPDSLALIHRCNEVIAEYREQGFTLTLRQLYYQMVARDVIPNKQKEYKRLGSIVNDARLAGLIDWSAIEDRTRNVEFINAWKSPEHIIEISAEQYKQDLWIGQTYRPEIWIEKEALIGVVEPVAERLRVPYFACRGYVSQSESFAAGMRFRSHLRNGQTPIVFHLGDHDPSGIDMTRDNADRLAMFAGQRVEVRRLALNMDQIEEFNPPPNPAKETDARFAGYSVEHGDESWELDALSPTVIDGLITEAVDSIRDEDVWSEAEAEEEHNREHLEAASRHWDRVRDLLDELE